MQYTKNRTIKSGVRYKCSFWRSAKGQCNAALNVKFDGRIVQYGVHGPSCFLKNGLNVDKHYGVNGCDCRGSMKQFVTERCVLPQHQMKSVQQVWEAAMEKYRASHGEAFSGLTKSEVKKLVYNTCNETFGSAAVSQVETQ